MPAVSFNLPEDVLKALREEARARNTSVSRLIRTSVETQLDLEKRKRAKSEFLKAIRSAALVEVTGETADEAAPISFGTGMPVVEAIILAGLVKAGCRTIYTRDEHFTRYAPKGVEIVLLGR